MSVIPPYIGTSNDKGGTTLQVGKYVMPIDRAANPGIFDNRVGNIFDDIYRAITGNLAPPLLGGVSADTQTWLDTVIPKAADDYYAQMNVPVPSPGPTIQNVPTAPDYRALVRNAHIAAMGFEPGPGVYANWVPKVQQENISQSELTSIFIAWAKDNPAYDHTGADLEPGYAARNVALLNSTGDPVTTMPLTENTDPITQAVITNHIAVYGFAPGNSALNTWVKNLKTGKYSVSQMVTEFKNYKSSHPAYQSPNAELDPNFEAANLAMLAAQGGPVPVKNDMSKWLMIGAGLIAVKKLFL